ncbi:MAG: hypothetical protein Q8R02_12105 [Hyphomonadaceae bacterium]|nr:hypothetical protein [Hyphomonadaceae bacterium]
MSKLTIAAAVCLAAFAFGGAKAEAQGPGNTFPDALDVQLARPNPLPFMKDPRPQDYEIRDGIVNRVHSLFLAGRFQELEGMAEAYRTNDRRTPAGAWKIDVFYQTFFGCMCEEEDQEARASALKGNLEQARKYKKQYPASPTPLLIEANILYAQAWHARGQGWAQKVSARDWQVFYDKIEEAQKLLEANADVVMRDPATSALMVDMASMTPVSDDVFISLVDSHMRVNGAYTPIYFPAMRLYYPNWRDSPQAIEFFARNAVKASEAREGKSLYARIYLHAYYEYGKDLYTATDVDKEYLRKAVFNLLNRYPDRHNFEVFGIMACDLEDWAMAAPIFARLQELPSQEYLHWGVDVPYQACRGKMYNLKRAL